MKIAFLWIAASLVSLSSVPALADNLSEFEQEYLAALGETSGQNGFQVQLKSLHKDSKTAMNDLIERKLHKKSSIQRPQDGDEMIVALKPARR
jgi:hypothetical protein